MIKTLQELIKDYEQGTIPDNINLIEYYATEEHKRTGSVCFMHPSQLPEWVKLKNEIEYVKFKNLWR